MRELAPLHARERSTHGGAAVLAAAVAALLFFVASIAVAAPSFPPLTGRVVDDAGILSQDTQTKLTDLLAQQEKQTGDQVVVATLKSLQGYPIEDYGYQLGRVWGIGQKGKNNGALIIVAPNEHRVRIEVGYGLEGVLTDAQSDVIIEEVMKPAFKQGNYDAGVYNGTLAVLHAIGGAGLDASPLPVPVQTNAHHGNPLVLLMIIFVLWLVLGRFFWSLLFLSVVGGGHYGRGGFGIGGFGSGGFGGGGFGGGGFGGGGFSGGGGSFGGGGASGGW